MGSLYYPTYCRLDGITLGVGLAAVKYFQPDVWKRLMQRGDLLLAGALFFLAVAVLAFWQRYSFLCSTVGFTCISLCFAFLTAGVLSEHHWLGRLRAPGAASVALLSYSIYLTHSLAMEYAGWLAGRLGLALQSGSGLLIATALILLFSTFLHYLVERPFLSLRDRLWSAGKGRSCRTALLPVPETQ
jgi:peptidoglycan/LPS O-acetylase OafA/YrhL